MKIGLFAGALAAVLSLAAPTGAEAADQPGRGYGTSEYASVRHPANRGYTGALRSCADPVVHSKIAYYFKRRELVFWKTGLELTAFTQIREVGYRSWGASFIPRRFCAANTVTTDGRRREVYWLVAEGLGAGSLGDGVDWCVTGLDRHMAFAPDCKMARP